MLIYMYHITCNSNYTANNDICQSNQTKTNPSKITMTFENNAVIAAKYYKNWHNTTIFHTTQQTDAMDSQTPKIKSKKSKRKT